MKNLLLSLLFFFSNCAVAFDYSKREDVKEFVKELAGAQSIDQKELLAIFAQAEYKQNIIDAVSRPAERVLNWSQYQDIFLTKSRVTGGLKFLRENHEALEAAEEDYGVPPVIITAIIGVETMYGRITGSYRVLDALATLSFDYPPRSKFFRSELKHFILLAKEEGQIITELTGSYAGAMGLGQFIPSSYRAYAIDFDGDGFRDIWSNPTDAIGSVANYLAVHGWIRGGKIALSVTEGSIPQEVFNVSLKPSISFEELSRLGLRENYLKTQEMVSPMRLRGKSGDEFWLGLHNFYVITRYNHSKLYAMSVYQLSEDLREAAIEEALL